MRITYIGHATLLIEIGGQTFLTDPNFDPSLGRLLPRVSEPGIPLHGLPHIDAVFVTHAHADHLSFTSLTGLRKDVPIFAPPAIARWLQRLGHSSAVPVAAGETVESGNVSIRAAEATHKGHRYGVDRWRGAVVCAVVCAVASYMLGVCQCTRAPSMRFAARHRAHTCRDTSSPAGQRQVHGNGGSRPVLRRHSRVVHRGRDALYGSVIAERMDD